MNDAASNHGFGACPKLNAWPVKLMCFAVASLAREQRHPAPIILNLDCGNSNKHYDHSVHGDLRWFTGNMAQVGSHGTYHVVVWGSTGLVGRLVSRHIAQHYQVHPKLQVRYLQSKGVSTQHPH